MSATAILWGLIAATLLLVSLHRPAYAVAFYMLTFFAAPNLWWWGKALPDLRYAIIAGLVLLVAVLLRPRGNAETPYRFGAVHVVAILMAANATFVHFLLASVPAVSLDNYVQLLKLVLLFFLIWRAIQERTDFRIVIMSLALGAAYIGYEVTINHRGSFTGSRLEGVGAPGADTSNGLACLFVTVLPLVGSLLIHSGKRHKLAAVVAAPLALNVVLLCNSRGAFLALIGSALSFLLLARGRARKDAIKALALGAVALFLLLGDPKILDRFATTFAGSEDRDASAASRMDFWRAGLKMIGDFPLGDGGNSFKTVRGSYYISQVTGNEAIDRALHNGYLTEATEWGLQGLLLRLIFIAAAASAAYKTIRRCLTESRSQDALVGVCLVAGLVGYLIANMFGSYILSEWGYWMVALLIRYSDVYLVPAPAATPEVAKAA